MSYKDQFIAYLKIYGKRLYFDSYIELFRDVNYLDYEKFTNWVHKNQDIIHNLYILYKKEIEIVEKEHKERFLAEHKKRCECFPTLRSLTTCVSMFDES